MCVCMCMYVYAQVALRLLDLAAPRQDVALQNTAVAGLGHLLRYALVNSQPPQPQHDLRGPGASSPGTETSDPPTAAAVAAGTGVRLAVRLLERRSGLATIIDGVVQSSSQRLQIGFLNIVNVIFWDEDKEPVSSGSFSPPSFAATGSGDKGLYRIRRELAQAKVIPAQILSLFASL